MRRWLVCFLLVLGVGVFSWRLRARDTSRWRTIAPGLEMRVLTVAASGGLSTLGGAVEVVALRTAPSNIRVLRGSTLDAAQWRRKAKSRAVINGGYFDNKGRPLGLRIADGKRFGSLHPANWGIFFIEKGVPKILHTRDFKREYSSYRRISQAVQSGPRLVVNGRMTDLKPQTARRTGIGIARDGKIIVAISDGALSFQDWAKLWAGRESLNCRDALNLDGGGSTQISLQAGKTAREVSGAWPVPDAIAIG